MIIAIINFSFFIISCLLMGYLYILSIQPVTRVEKYGEKAWNQCKRFRSIGGLFELISVVNLLLWIWFPLPLVNLWIVNPNIWVGITSAILIAVPCCIIMFLGIKAAGSETLSPSKDTEMYGGIYRYIRHPQSLGEFPLFIAISFALNSWFLVLISLLFIIIYIPIMIYYEEKDLVKRFGDKYREYQKITGALFPKFRR
ncbi:MAG: isoprenylcysteine carboxylmethyltransferase family protein [Candidatus Lokiarchaeota archaeon]|nr:isoprenylcysteine carboxylmethyltransferase family protein [Candidatus Lokiarchaeota archaeon]